MLSFIAHSFSGLLKGVATRYRGLRASHLEVVKRYRLYVHGQVTTMEFNEPVAPEFHDILRMFQTSRNCSDLRDMSFHTYDMPRLLNQRELLGSAGTMGQPRT